MSSIAYETTSLPHRASISKHPADAIISGCDDEKFDHDGPLEPTRVQREAREIIRQFQCPRCSLILAEPVTLPCGNSICRQCIPETHVRQNISYPGTPDRVQGFTCPLAACGLDHAVGDSKVDVVLNNIANAARKMVDNYRTSPTASAVVLALEEKDEWLATGMPRLGSNKQAQILAGGHFIATYTMAETGGLPYSSDVIYTIPPSTSDESITMLDLDVLETVRDIVRSELDCKVCYSILLDPFTTSCGHTFCRECLNQVLNHSNLCPLCRRTQAIPPGARPADAPSNVVLSELVDRLCSEALAARIELSNLEDPKEDDVDVALFVCTLAFPQMPTFLHIFEPRYRLMIQRALEGNREFGMLRHNPSKEPQGQLGKVHFYQYGTMLQIRNVQLLPDGRSVLETFGASRFRVLTHRALDGYTIGKIERVDDLSLAGEEAFEARDRSARPQSAHSRNFSAQDHFGAPPHHLPTEKLPIKFSDLDTMSTLALFEICIAFVESSRKETNQWLHRHVFQVYGECPKDPSKFPWWFASVLPVTDAEKYRLLSTTTVRERIKISAEWVLSIESQRLYCEL